MFNNLSTKFYDGQEAAKKDLQNGDIYNLEAAIHSFDYDPPDSPRQRGYLHQLILERK